MTSFTGENLNDLFEWGNERFVMGRIADSSAAGAKRKKTARELFMDAILDPEENKSDN